MNLDQQAGRLQPADHPVCLDATTNVKDSEQRRKIAGESSLCLYFTRAITEKSTYAVLENLEYICRIKKKVYTYDTMST
jgi:hypothetical protein